MRPPITTTSVTPPKQSATPSAPKQPSHSAPRVELALNLNQTEQTQLKALLANWPKQKVSGTVVEPKEQGQPKSGASANSSTNSENTRSGQQPQRIEGREVVQPKTAPQATTEQTQTTKEKTQTITDAQARTSKPQTKAENTQPKNSLEYSNKRSEQPQNRPEPSKSSPVQQKDKSEATHTTPVKPTINNEKSTQQPKMAESRAHLVEIKLPNKQTVSVNLQQALPAGAKVELSLNKQGDIALTTQDKAILSTLTGKSSGQSISSSTQTSQTQTKTSQGLAAQHISATQSPQTKPVLSPQKHALAQMITPLLKQSLAIEQPLSKTFTALSQLAPASQNTASNTNINNTNNLGTNSASNLGINSASSVETKSTSHLSTGKHSHIGGDATASAKNTNPTAATNINTSTVTKQSALVKNATVTHTPQTKEPSQTQPTPNTISSTTGEVKNQANVPQIQGQPLNQTIKALNQVLNIIQSQSNLTNAQAVKTALINSGLFAEQQTSPASLVQAIRHLSNPAASGQAASNNAYVNSSGTNNKEGINTNSSTANTSQEVTKKTSTEQNAPKVIAVSPSSNLSKSVSVSLPQVASPQISSPSPTTTVASATSTTPDIDGGTRSGAITSTQPVQTNINTNGQNSNGAINLKTALLATLKIALAESQQLNRNTGNDSPIDKGKSLTIERIVQQLLKPDISSSSEKEKPHSLAAKTMANIQSTQNTSHQGKHTEVNQHLKQAVSPDLFKAISLYSAMLPGQDRPKTIEADNPVARLFQLLLGALGKAQTTQLQTLQQQTVNQDPQLLQTWTFEVPFHQNERYQSCDLTIEQYKDDNKDGEQNSRNWRILLGFELDDMGDLFIELNLKGEKASSQIWANNKTAYQSVKDEVQFLRDSLTAVGVEVTSIDCHHGEPPDRNTHWGEIDDQIVDLHT